MFCTRQGIVVATLIGFVACGGSPGSPTAPSNPGTVLLPGNRPPVIESLIASPEFGIADLEVFTFDVKASDPDGDRLTYLWRLDLGPGGSATGSGPRATARYTGGVSTTWSVEATVTDTSGASAARTITVTVGSVNGRWAVTSGALAGASFFLLQSDSGAVTGEYFLPGAGALERLEGSQVGHIDRSAAITLPLRLGSRSLPFTGTMDTTGRRIAGTIDGSPCVLISQQ